MADAYKTFRELATWEMEWEAWTRSYESRGSRILVMAPHGGWIEPFTDHVARAVAESEFSLYIFEGIRLSGSHRLHLTSHRFDEPLAMRAVEEAGRVLAIHGEKTSECSFVMVGGGWARFRESLEEALAKAAFRVEPPGPGLEGTHPRNICNRGRTGPGGQLEISEGLRRILREDPAMLERFVRTVRRVLAKAEAWLLDEDGAVRERTSRVYDG